MPTIFFRLSFWALEKVMVFPLFGKIFKSLSKTLVNCKLKSFSPEKPESTINKDIAPTTTPTAAMPVIILMALLLLLENK